MKLSKEGLTLTGAFAAALAASACCIAPLLLAGLGLGGAAFVVALEPYRPGLTGVTLVLLAGAFYMVYRRPIEQACAENGACAAVPRRRFQKVVLWVVSTMVLGALTFPYYVNYLL